MSNLTDIPQDRAVVPKKPKNKKVKGEVVRMGRPTIFSDKLALSICEMLADGHSLREVSAKDGMPDLRTLRRWLRDKEDFRLQYAIARDEQADLYADTIAEIAKGSLAGVYDPNAARVAIDAYKWTASKLKPKKYGDKIDHTTNGKDLPSPILGVLAVPNTTNGVISESSTAEDALTQIESE